MFEKILVLIAEYIEATWAQAGAAYRNAGYPAHALYCEKKAGMTKGLVSGNGKGAMHT